MKLRTVPSAATSCLLVVLATGASAQQEVFTESAPEDPPVAAARAERASPSPAYGTQTLVVDAIGLGLLAIGSFVSASSISQDGDTVPYAGLLAAGAGSATYLFGAPVVHAIRGRPLASLGSLGLRLAAPIAGVGLGALAGGDSGDSQATLAIVGGVVGALTAVAIDAAAIARIESAPKTPNADPPAPTTARLRSLSPSLNVSKGQARFGIAATF